MKTILLVQAIADALGGQASVILEMELVTSIGPAQAIANAQLTAAMIPGTTVTALLRLRSA